MPRLWEQSGRRGSAEDGGCEWGHKAFLHRELRVRGSILEGLVFVFLRCAIGSVVCVLHSLQQWTLLVMKGSRV